MNIETIILLLILAGVAAAIFLIIKQKTSKDEVGENKEAEEIANLKTEMVMLKDTLNTTINTCGCCVSNLFDHQEKIKQR